MTSPVAEGAAAASGSPLQAPSAAPRQAASEAASAPPQMDGTDNGFRARSPTVKERRIGAQCMFDSLIDEHMNTEHPSERLTSEDTAREIFFELGREAARRLRLNLQGSDIGFHHVREFLYQIFVVVDATLRDEKDHPLTPAKRNAISLLKLNICDVLNEMDATTSQDACGAGQFREILNCGSRFSASLLNANASSHVDGREPSFSQAAAAFCSGSSKYVGLASLANAYGPVVRLLLWAMEPMRVRGPGDAAAPNPSRDLLLLIANLERSATYVSQMISIQNALVENLYGSMAIAAQSPMHLALELRKYVHGELSCSTMALTDNKGRILAWYAYGASMTKIPEAAVLHRQLPELCVNQLDVAEALKTMREEGVRGHHCKPQLVVLKIPSAEPLYLRCTWVWHCGDAGVSEIMWRAEDVTELFTKINQLTSDLTTTRAAPVKVDYYLEMERLSRELAKAEQVIKKMKRKSEQDSAEMLEISSVNKRLKQTLDEYQKQDSEEVMVAEQRRTEHLTSSLANDGLFGDGASDVFSFQGRISQHVGSTQHRESMLAVGDQDFEGWEGSFR